MSPTEKWTPDALAIVKRIGIVGEPQPEAKKPRAAGPRLSRFPINWSFDRSFAATVLINRGAGTISVRPYKRRKVYTLPLSTVAELIASRVELAEAAAKRAARKARRARR